MGEWFEKQRVGDLPGYAAARHGDRLALIAGGRRWTFREFERSVEQLAAALVGSGVRHGDRVAVWLTNCPEWIQLLYALARIGAVLVPLNTRYRTVDVAYAIRQSRCSLLVLRERSGPVDFLDMLHAALPGLREATKRVVATRSAPCGNERCVVMSFNSVDATLLVAGDRRTVNGPTRWSTLALQSRRRVLRGGQEGRTGSCAHAGHAGGRRLTLGSGAAAAGRNAA